MISAMRAPTIAFDSKRDEHAWAKRMGRPPTGKGHPIMVRLQPNFLKALDRWRENQRRTLSRPEAIRQLAWLGLLHQGAVGG
jgi:hypothetical protein